MDGAETCVAARCGMALSILLYARKQGERAGGRTVYIREGESNLYLRRRQQSYRKHRRGKMRPPAFLRNNVAGLFREVAYFFRPEQYVLCSRGNGVLFH